MPNSHRFAWAAFALVGLSVPARGLTSLSLAAAIDHNGNATQSVIAGAQWELEEDWLEHPRWGLGLSLDATVAYHHSGHGASDQQELWDGGLAAVFALSFGRAYFEFGSGPHAISATVLGDQDLSSVFQMGSVFGLGYRFERWTLGYRYQHLSNGEIVLPNEGLDLHALRVVWRL